MTFKSVYVYNKYNMPESPKFGIMQTRHYYYTHLFTGILAFVNCVLYLSQCVTKYSKIMSISALKIKGQNQMKLTGPPMDIISQ